MSPIIILIILIILYPVVRWLADKEIKRSNKKVQDHYKMLEEKRKAEYEEFLKEQERQEKMDKIIEQYEKDHPKPDSF